MVAPVARRWRIIDISGTTPDPPATRSSGSVRVPDEVTADRTAELELVADPQLADQVRRDLAVGQGLHGDREAVVFRSRRDRVAALRLVAVLGGEAHVDVLSRPMTGPVRHVEDDAPHARRLVDQLDDVAEHPAQSPAYRCSRHGSP